jgi:hypothetical protein
MKPCKKYLPEDVVVVCGPENSRLQYVQKYQKKI